MAAYGLFGIVWMASTYARATTLTGVDVGRMAERSSMVVIAQVEDQRLVPTPGGTFFPVETHSELRIERYLKGAGPGRLVVRQLGRRIGADPAGVADDARFEPGQRVLLFLRARRDRIVHLTLLGYSAYTLRSAAGRVQALPHARLPHDETSRSGPTASGFETSLPTVERESTVPALGAPTSLAALERMIGGTR
jgi:hypothetical protein